MTQESRNIPQIAACSRPELLLDALERGRTELCQVEAVVGHGDLVVSLLARRRGRRALRLQADDRRAVVIVERPQHTVPEQVAHVHEGPSSLKATILAEIKEEIAEHGC